MVGRLGSLMAGFNETKPGGERAPPLDNYMTQIKRAGRPRGERTILLQNIGTASSPPHLCGIDGCTKRFKRMEHLKRHRNT